jgi:hypothetical protein
METMRRWLAVIMIIALAGLMWGCGGTAKTPEDTPLEKLLDRSTKERPAWTLKKPETKSGVMYVVGVSMDMANEQLGRSRAMQNARTEMSNYLGTLVKAKIEQANIDFGLASDVVDPTASAREYGKQMSANFISQLEGTKFYWEQRKKLTGIGYRYFALCRIPEKMINDGVREDAAKRLQDAQRRAKEQSDRVAKEQLEKAGAMWAQLEQQGLFKD